MSENKQGPQEPNTNKYKIEILLENVIFFATILVSLPFLQFVTFVKGCQPVKNIALLSTTVVVTPTPPPPSPPKNSPYEIITGISMLEDFDRATDLVKTDLLNNDSRLRGPIDQLKNTTEPYRQSVDEGDLWDSSKHIDISFDDSITSSESNNLDPESAIRRQNVVNALNIFHTELSGLVGIEKNPKDERFKQSVLGAAQALDDLEKRGDPRFKFQRLSLFIDDSVNEGSIFFVYRGPTQNTPPVSDTSSSSPGGST